MGRMLMQNDETVLCNFIMAIIFGGLGLTVLYIGIKMIYLNSLRKEPTGDDSAGKNSEEYFRERNRILDMLSAGQLNGGEAERLLLALDQGLAGEKKVSPLMACQSMVSLPRVLIGIGFVIVSLWFFSVAIDYVNINTGAGRENFYPRLNQNFVNPSGMDMKDMISRLGPIRVEQTNPLGRFFPFIPWLVWGIGLALFIFWILMLIDCIRRPPGFFTANPTLTSDGQYDKLIWIIGLVLASILASIVYYFVVYRRAVSGQPV